MSTLALIGVAQRSSAAAIAKQKSQFDVLNAARKSQFDMLNDILTNQHSLLMKMVARNTAQNAQMAKHSERMDRVEILFDKLNQQLPNFARCVEVCLEVGTNVEAGASTLASIRD